LQWHEYRFVPFMGDIITHMTSLYGLAEGALPTGFEYTMVFGSKESVPAPSDDTWAWFSKVYGVTQDDCQEFKTRCLGELSLPYLAVPTAGARLLMDTDC